MSLLLVPTVSGRWVYSFQGLMQFTSPFNWAVDPQSTMEVGWAYKDAPDNNGNHDTLQNFTPIPLTVINRPPTAQKPNPITDPIPGALPAPPNIATVAGFGAQTNPPISGYLPYTECGYFNLSPDVPSPPPTLAGSLIGKLWFTIAGAAATFPNPFVIKGRYKLNDIHKEDDPNDPDLPHVWPVGAMSFTFANSPPGFVWDYSFILSSHDEGQIMPIGRKQRPATGLGTMKRARWIETLHYEQLEQ